MLLWQRLNSALVDTHFMQCILSCFSVMEKGRKWWRSEGAFRVIYMFCLSSYDIIIFCLLKKTGPQKQHNTSPHFELFMLNFISYQNLGRRNYAFAQELVLLFSFIYKIVYFNAPKNKQKINKNHILSIFFFIIIFWVSPKTKLKWAFFHSNLKHETIFLIVNPWKPLVE